MIGSLITSQTRIKLLKKFFLNCSIRSHLRGLGAEFDESTNAIRIELNRLERAGLLNSNREGNKKFYQANKNHPLFKDIHNIILKETGMDHIIDKVICKIGNLTAVYVTGAFAQGRDSVTIDLLIVGNDLNREYLLRKITQAEELSGRIIRYVLINKRDQDTYLEKISPSELLLLWEESKNDKT
jgi:hypothetical protein